jgi:hypothetical protein
MKGEERTKTLFSAAAAHSNQLKDIPITPIASAYKKSKRDMTVLGNDKNLLCHSGLRYTNVRICTHT